MMNDELNIKRGKFKFEGAQSLVELVLAIGLSVILLPALLTGFLASREGKAQNSKRIEAVALLRSTVEQVRSIREKDWDLFTNGTFHPEVSGSSFILASGSDLINSFTRTIEISNVNRDSSGTIVALGGTTDPSTKKIIATVSWGSPISSSINSTLYLTRYLNNNAFIQTTEADFNLGTKTGVAVTNTSGGEVVLGAGGQGDWCTPNLSLNPLDLPKSGVANALSVIEGRAFAGTGENASGVSFADVNITNTNPPVPSIGATFDGYKTNAVFGETNYAYLATDNNSKEIVIIDLNNIVNGKYQEVGYFDAPGTGDGRTVFVANIPGYGNVGFMSNSSSVLYAFGLGNDLAGHSGSRPLLQGKDTTIAGVITKIIVVGTYAYMSVNSATSYDLKVMNVSNPSNMQFWGHTNFTAASTQDIFVNSTGTRAYLATTANAGREFFVLDTSAVFTCSSNCGNTVFPVLGSYEANGMSAKGVTVVTNNRAIIVGTGEEEYQVLNIENLGSITRCGGLNIDTGVNGVASVIEADGDAYSYIITGDASAEFKIIAGGAGGAGYASSGTFESSTLDSLSSSAFNRFDVSVNRLSNTNIEFQVAVKQGVLGSCTGVAFTSSDFVGPSATSSDKFQTSVTSGIQIFNYSLPTSINPGQCFRYKADFSTSDSLSSPIFYDTTINYSQ